MFLTVKLNSGVIVLAKSTKYGVAAMTFANKTQAERAAAKVDGWVWKSPMSRPFYVRFDQGAA